MRCSPRFASPRRCTCATKRCSKVSSPTTTRSSTCWMGSIPCRAPATICNRAALYSTCGALLALLAYRRLRSRGGTAWSLCVGFAYTFALAYGEYAYCMLGYLLAYEWQHGKAGRVRAVAPVLLPALAFGVLRALAHAGVSHSGVYVDPLA